MAKIVNIYILSNNYTVEFYQTGSSKNATLYSPDHKVILIRNASLLINEENLVQELITENWLSNSPSIKDIKTPPSNSSSVTLINKYKIEGKVIDAISYNGLSGISISIITKGDGKNITTKTDKDGLYSLDILLITNDSGIPNEKPNITFSDSTGKYSSNSIIPFTQDNQLLEFPDPVKMKLQKQDLEEKKSQYKQISSNTLKQATNLIPKSPEEALINFIKTQIKVLLGTLLPMLLTMLAAFGIDKLQDFLKGNGGICPKRSKLDELIKLRNQIVSQLNSISKSLDILIKAIGIAQGLVVVLKVIFNIILALPIPVSVPPGIGIPQSIIQKGADIIQTLKRLADQVLSVSITVLMALLIIKSTIALILSLLKALDNLLLICYPSAILIGLDDNLISIQNEMDNADKNSTQNSGDSLTRRVNGFTLSVQVLEINSVGGLKRKQAIAKNSQGIIMISGEPSFSASEQILLDELGFHITSNNLKAQ